MALITGFEHVPVKAGRRQSTTICEWFVTNRDGERVVQLDTGGSESRANPGKTSQTLQVDHTRAVELIEILRLAFPDSGVDL